MPGFQVRRGITDLLASPGVISTSDTALQDGWRKFTNVMAWTGQQGPFKWTASLIISFGSSHQENSRHPWLGVRVSSISSSAEGCHGTFLLPKVPWHRQMFKPYIRARCCPWLQVALGSGPAPREVSRKAPGSFSRAVMLWEMCSPCERCCAVSRADLHLITPADFCRAALSEDVT